MGGIFDPTKDGQIWAFDPGAVFTGLAGVFYERLDTVENLRPKPDDDFTWVQYSSVEELYDHFVKGFTRYKNTVVLVEDYTHGGTFTKEAKQTLKVVGFLETQLRRDGYHVVLRHKDQRLSGQSDAARLMEGSVTDLKKDPARKDGFSALAHCITYHREMEALRVRD